MNLTISKKLPIVIVLIAVTSVVISGSIAFWQTRHALEAAAFNKLKAIEHTRSSQVSSYMHSIHEELITFSHDHMIIDAIKGSENGFSEFGPDKENISQKLYIDKNPNALEAKQLLDFTPDGSVYSAMHKKYHPFFRQLLKSRGYNDIYLLNQFGDVVYSVYKESDCGTNIMTGKWKNSDLGNIFRDVKQNAVPNYLAYTDFVPYAPSAGVPTSFMAAPVFGYNGDFTGTIIF